MNQPVGVVLGTREKQAEALEFWVAVEDEAYLQLDDVVYVQTPLPGKEHEIITFYGTVQFVTRFFEGIPFDSDTKRAAQGLLPVNLTYAANISITRVIPSIFIPPRPGDPVFRAEGKRLQEGLFADRMVERLPSGILRTGDPYYLNYDFISGQNGAHVSISGVSGIATKTTYATFLLYSIMNSGVLKGEQANTRAIIFNVKGEDLLFLDQRNTNLPPSEEDKYRALGLPVTAFESVNLYAPARPSQDALIPSTERRRTGITPYMWTLRQVANERLFSFLFAESGEEFSSLLQLIRIVENALASTAKDGKNDEEPLVSPTGAKVADLFELYEDISANEAAWFGAFPRHQGQVNAFLRRLHNAAFQTRGLIRRAPAGSKKPKYRINWQEKQVTVVDIHSLTSAAKMFVVGALVKTIFREKEEQGTSHPHVFVLLDELNKYAPREGFSPIQDVLLDVAERGRSLGVILIGAQQTASEVEPRIFSNCAIRVAGRMDSAEVEHKEYGFLGPIFRKRARIISPGTMIVHQPDVPTPILLTFPFPAWATRPDEVDRSSADKQDDPFDF